MKPPICHFFHLFLLAALIAPLPAEEPLLSGLRGSFIAFAPATRKTSGKARTAAAGLISRYIRPADGSSLTIRTAGPSRTRMEIKGLRLTRVLQTARSQVDLANGIAERYLVSVECEKYRTFDDKSASWSPWTTGTAPVMPSTVYVGHRTDGQWNAASPVLAGLSEFTSSGNPDLVLSNGPR